MLSRRKPTTRSIRPTARWGAERDTYGAQLLRGRRRDLGTRPRFRYYSTLVGRVKVGYQHTRTPIVRAWRSISQMNIAQHSRHAGVKCLGFGATVFKLNEANSGGDDGLRCGKAPESIDDDAKEGRVSVRWKAKHGCLCSRALAEPQGPTFADDEPGEHGARSRRIRLDGETFSVPPPNRCQGIRIRGRSEAIKTICLPLTASRPVRPNPSTEEANSARLSTESSCIRQRFHASAQ